MITDEVREDARHVVCAWLREHDIDPHDTPWDGVRLIGPVVMARQFWRGSGGRLRVNLLTGRPCRALPVVRRIRRSPEPIIREFFVTR